MHKFIDKYKNFFCPYKKIFLKDIVSVLSLYSGLLINFIAWAILRWKIPPHPGDTILHYNAFLGIDNIIFNTQDQYYLVFAAPFSGLIIWLMDLILAAEIIRNKDGEEFENDKAKKIFLKAEVIGARLILATGALVQMAILVYSVGIIKVNT